MAGQSPTLELSNKMALGAGPRASNWVQGLDLNQRPSGYEPDELPGCSTLQQTEGQGATQGLVCQILSLFQADAHLRCTRIGIVQGQGHGGCGEVLDADTDQAGVDPGREKVALLVELAIDRQLRRVVHGHDAPDAGDLDRMLKEDLAALGRGLRLDRFGCRRCRRLREVFDRARRFMAGFTDRHRRRNAERVAAWG